MLRPIGIAVLLIAILLTTGHLAPLSAEPSGHPPHQQNPQIRVPAVWIIWRKASWTGDDRPYRATRTDIDALAVKGELTAALIAKYSAEAGSKHNDPQTLFRWAYAWYQSQQIHPPVHLPYFINEEVFEAAPFPNTYDYARLEFITSASDAPSPGLAIVGKRLLQREPNDYDVEYGLVHSFQPWQSQAAKQEALFYANDLLRKYPSKPSAHAAIGWVYFSTWMVKRDKADGEKAIAAGRDYLRLAPPNYEARPQMEKTIQYIEQRLGSG